MPWLRVSSVVLWFQVCVRTYTALVSCIQSIAVTISGRLLLSPCAACILCFPNLELNFHVSIAIVALSNKICACD